MVCHLKYINCKRLFRKGLSGGKLTFLLLPPSTRRKTSLLERCLYGAITGEYINGMAGERFCVELRVLAVVEGSRPMDEYIILEVLWYY